MPTVTGYPPAVPTISGNALTIDLWLNSPARVQRSLERLTALRFLADRVFDTGPQATGGAVVYDQVVANDLFTDRDVEEIAPLGEVPLLTESAPTPKVAKTAAWGGAFEISVQQIRRNRIDIVRREFAKLANTVLRKVDAKALAEMDAAVTAGVSNTFGGASWSAGGTTDATLLGNIIDARGLIDNPDNGYMASILLLNPAQRDSIAKRPELLKLLTGIAGATIRQGIDITVGEIDGLSIFVSNRVTAGTAWIAQAGAIGGISDEAPLQTETIPLPKQRGVRIQAVREFAAYVDQPKAMVKLTGIS